MKERLPIPAEEKLERIPISREHFIAEILERVHYWESVGDKADQEIGELRSILRKVYEAEALGFRTYYFWEGDDLKFEAREKGKFGFRSVVKNNEASKNERRQN